MVLTAKRMRGPDHVHITVDPEICAAAGWRLPATRAATAEATSAASAPQSRAGRCQVVASESVGQTFVLGFGGFGDVRDACGRSPCSSPSAGRFQAQIPAALRRTVEQSGDIANAALPLVSHTSAKRSLAWNQSTRPGPEPDFDQQGASNGRPI